MIILKFIMAILVLLVIPELIGLLIVNFIQKEKNNIILSFIIGYLTEFAICQLVAIPLMFLKASFLVLLYSFGTIVVLLSIASIIVNIKRFKEIILSSINIFKEIPKFEFLVVVALIFLQVYALMGYMHMDDDDAFYVGTATTAIETNTIFEYNALTGTQYKTLPLRYALGPFPLFIAIVSKCINVHTAIVAHIVIPAIFIPLVYMIYASIAEKVFKRNKKATMLFLLMMCILNIWGNYSIRTTFSFLLFRIWQGKSVLANIIIPSVWLMYLLAEDNNFNKFSYLLILIILIAGVFSTTMGIGLSPIVLMVLAFLHSIQNKEIKNFVKCGICCIPCLIYGVLYLVL